MHGLPSPIRASRGVGSASNAAFMGGTPRSRGPMSPTAVVVSSAVQVCEGFCVSDQGHQRYGVTTSRTRDDGITRVTVSEPISRWEAAFTLTPEQLEPITGGVDASRMTEREWDAVTRAIAARIHVSEPTEEAAPALTCSLLRDQRGGRSQGVLYRRMETRPHLVSERVSSRMHSFCDSTTGGSARGHAFPVGSFVEARYGGHDAYQEAVVVGTNPDGTYDVRYDDEEVERSVPPMLLRQRTGWTADSSAHSLRGGHPDDVPGDTLRGNRSVVLGGEMHVVSVACVPATGEAEVKVLNVRDSWSGHAVVPPAQVAALTGYDGTEELVPVNPGKWPGVFSSVCEATQVVAQPRRAVVVGWGPAASTRADARTEARAATSIQAAARGKAARRRVDQLRADGSTAHRRAGGGSDLPALSARSSWSDASPDETEAVTRIQALVRGSATRMTPRQRPVANTFSFIDNEAAYLVTVVRSADGGQTLARVHDVAAGVTEEAQVPDLLLHTGGDARDSDNVWAVRANHRVIASSVDWVATGRPGQRVRFGVEE